MKTECLILVISKRPLLCEGLKCLLKETAQVTVITTPDEESARSSCGEVMPDIVIVDRPHIRAYKPMYFLQEQDKPLGVVILGWDDDKLAAYSREQVLPATLQNLGKVIKNYVLLSKLDSRWDEKQT